MDSTPGDKISSNSICDQCDLLPIQTNFSEYAIKLQPKAPTSPSTGREKECDSEKRGLGLQQLCQKQSIGTFSTLETKLTNLTTFNFNERAGSQAILHKLSCDLEAQYFHDVPSLLNILKSFYPFNEISGDVLEDYEINDFFKLYNISNIRPILARRELREALVNYLFYQDNICYIVEFTHEIIPKNEIKQKAKELADLCKPINIDDIEWKVTKESLNSIKRNKKKRRKE
ncbi:hypothetical protein GLOIN_2v1776421 [Rhizophagus irregularis DAOM 181602=DAOM 197198]|nr:hypothetical protein GLOIN_2v1776421 [Rhizophagus irregularis DAOM 181602=DAOM 197198]